MEFTFFQLSVVLTNVPLREIARNSASHISVVGQAGLGVTELLIRSGGEVVDSQALGKVGVRFRLGSTSLMLGL